MRVNPPKTEKPAPETASSPLSLKPVIWVADFVGTSSNHKDRVFGAYPIYLLDFEDTSSLLEVEGSQNNVLTALNYDRDILVLHSIQRNNYK
nr:hypothetical protein HmN_000916000 [Hymenolepis microstoma]